MGDTKQISVSDDEEDLEALRIAALKSLKKKVISNEDSVISQGVVNFPPHPENEARPDSLLRHGNFSGKRGRFFGGRGPKNGQFHGSRVRSSNLISITPVVTEENDKSKSLEIFSSTTKSLEADKSEETSSKFDRFNDFVDKSDDETEEEAPNTSSEDGNIDSPVNLERSNSLEALMQELDDEIQGRSKNNKKTEKPVKVKSNTKKRKEKITSEINIDGDKAESEKKVDGVKQEQQKGDKLEIDTKKEPVKDPREKNLRKESLLREKSEEREPEFKRRRYSPPIKRDFHNYRGKIRNLQPYPPYQQTFLPNAGPLQFPRSNLPSVVTSAFGPPNLGVPPIKVPPFYERPLSPLLINADTLQTQTMAPLSPRSAAFVLENRAIIEKRKRSPRRSYSRSLSPRRRSLSPRSPRRSLSPRRSISPRRSVSPRRSISPRRSVSPRRSLSPRRRSRSPKRKSLTPKRRSLSPRQKPFSPKLRQFSPKPRQFSPISPKRKSPSPRRRSVSPKRRTRRGNEETGNSPKNKPSIRDRLGFKSSSKTDNKESKDDKSPSPKKEGKLVDPVLEARRRKFESKEIKMREGVIRLKPKDEKIDEKPLDIKKSEEKLHITKECEDKLYSTKKTEEKLNVTNDTGELKQIKSTEVPKVQTKDEILNEDALLEDDELELESKVNLFSDDESGSENEGRFKAKEQTIVKPATFMFSKLINGAKNEVKPKPLTENKTKQDTARTSARSRSPLVRKTDNNKTDEKISIETANNAKKIGRSDKLKKRIVLKSKRHPTPKRFERKIEIKIKNPSKYEKEDKQETETEGQDRNIRKVELGDATKNETEDEDDFETEIVVENEEDENIIGGEGDLRAQLSKKRAEKLQKTTSESVPSRLLQNALQNALPLKKPKKSKTKELSTSDGKLPIHLRLGIACSSDIFSKSKRKSRKRKNIETEDQV